MLEPLVKSRTDSPLPPAAEIQAFVKDRTVEWGIWAPGLPSLNPLVEKLGKRKETQQELTRLEGPGSTLGVPPLPSPHLVDRLETASSLCPRCAPLLACPPRPAKQDKEANRLPIHPGRGGQGFPTCTNSTGRGHTGAGGAGDAGAWPKSSRKLSSGPRPGHRAGGQRPG